MAYAPTKRASLLIPFNEAPHLFVVMNDPTPKGGECLLLMLTSIKPKRPCDPACLLAAADHEFVKHETYICYRLAQITVDAHIANMVAKNYYKPRSDFSGSVFERIRLGLWSSLEIRPRVLDFAKLAGLDKS